MFFNRTSSLYGDRKRKRNVRDTPIAINCVSPLHDHMIPISDNVFRTLVRTWGNTILTIPKAPVHCWTLVSKQIENFSIGICGRLYCVKCVCSIRSHNRLTSHTDCLA